ncbi:hypothetical protein MCEGEM3_00207 [Oxalobacteraceae bacterium]
MVAETSYEQMRIWWGRRESPGLRACKRESAASASSMLDQIRPCAAFAPAGAKSLRRQQACLLKPRLHPRVPRVRFPPLAITSKKYRLCRRHFFTVVEAAGISRSSRLQARIRSQARRMRREFPVRPASRGFGSHHLRSPQKNTALAGGIFLKWWRRRESNPRPEVLYRQFYILSVVIWI